MHNRLWLIALCLLPAALVLIARLLWTKRKPNPVAEHPARAQIAELEAAGWDFVSRAAIPNRDPYHKCTLKCGKLRYVGQLPVPDDVLDQMVYDASARGCQS